MSKELEALEEVISQLKLDHYYEEGSTFEYWLEEVIKNGLKRLYELEHVSLRKKE